MATGAGGGRGPATRHATVSTRRTTSSLDTSVRPPKSPSSPLYSQTSTVKGQEGLPAVGLGMFSQIAGGGGRSGQGQQVQGQVQTPLVAPLVSAPDLDSPHGRNTRRRFLARPGAESQEREDADPASAIQDTVLPSAPAPKAPPKAPPAVPAIAKVAAGSTDASITTGTGRKRGRPPKKKRGIAARKAAEAAAAAAAAAAASATATLEAQVAIDAQTHATEAVPSFFESKKQHPDVRIIFSGIEPESELVKAIPGAVEVVDPSTATHLILGSKKGERKMMTATSSPGAKSVLLRTPKLMLAINAGIKYVVCFEWLLDSASAKSALPIDVSTSEGEGVGYLVRDEDRQTLYGFDMRGTLATAEQRREAGGSNVFANLAIYCTAGVCGVSAPSEAEMAKIIESGSGVWLGAGANLESRDGNLLPSVWSERLRELQVSPAEVQIVVLSSTAALQSLSSRAVAPRSERSSHSRCNMEGGDERCVEALGPSLAAFLRSPSPALRCPQPIAASLHGRVLSPEFIFQSVLRQTLIIPDSTKDIAGQSTPLAVDGEEDTEPIVLLDTTAITATAAKSDRALSSTAVRSNKRTRIS